MGAHVASKSAGSGPAWIAGPRALALIGGSVAIVLLLFAAAIWAQQSTANDLRRAQGELTATRAAVVSHAAAMRAQGERLLATAQRSASALSVCLAVHGRSHGRRQPSGDSCLTVYPLGMARYDRADLPPIVASWPARSVWLIATGTVHSGLPGRPRSEVSVVLPPRKKSGSVMAELESGLEPETLGFGRMTRTTSKFHAQLKTAFTDT